MLPPDDFYVPSSLLLPCCCDHFFHRHLLKDTLEKSNEEKGDAYGNLASSFGSRR